MMDAVKITSDEHADIETASAGYAARFAGAAGAWMLSVQEKTVLRWLEQQPRATVLDVGGGHGQLALPLARAGSSVTVLGSAGVCVKRIEPEVQAGQIKFVVGDVIALPFPDRAFDVVVSIRLLPHCDAWPKLIAELCRVAQRTVIVDYPTTQSVNFFSAALFGVKKKIEQNTRPFTLFRHGEVATEFARCGFAVAERKGEFFLPMVLHRMLSCPALSAMLEGICGALGLKKLFGSPVLVLMKRVEKN
ncbi:MAG: class I SAM-dependent methyltransferase [Verrucomicrobia bacterium]|nr:MAG: class I SAM-dependent methyltransferase [Verrucomicrobiota bacterium]